MKIKYYRKKRNPNCCNGSGPFPAKPEYWSVLLIGFLLSVQVIENHSKQQERQRQDDATESVEGEEDTQEEVVTEEVEEEEEDEYLRVEEVYAISPDASSASQSSPYADSRLVKSHSEAPIGSPKGEGTTHSISQKAFCPTSFKRFEQ